MLQNEIASRYNALKFLYHFLYACFERIKCVRIGALLGFRYLVDLFCDFDSTVIDFEELLRNRLCIVQAVFQCFQTEFDEQGATLSVLNGI